jgi:NAD(P)-dependent dehydrogenase (short-subunit alcohol dehydrogenase family)
MASPLFDLTNRTAVVTGATSGTGRAFALGFADADAGVVPTGGRAKLSASGVNQ